MISVYNKRVAFLQALEEDCTDMEIGDNDRPCE